MSKLKVRRLNDISSGYAQVEVGVTGSMSLGDLAGVGDHVAGSGTTALLFGDGAVGAGGGGWRANEPGGMTVIEDENWSSPSGEYTSSNKPVGWNFFEQRSDVTTGRVTDATEPSGSGYALNWLFDTDHPGGVDPDLLMPQDFLADSPTEPDLCYVCFYHKVDSGYYGHPANNKLIFIQGNDEPSGPLVPSIKGGGSNTLYYYAATQGPTIGLNAWGPDDATSECVRDTWHLVEILVTMNSGESSGDGKCEMWIDGTKIVNETTLNWCSGNLFWNGLKIQPIWGGTGQTIPDPQYHRFGRFYISKKAA